MSTLAVDGELLAEVAAAAADAERDRALMPATIAALRDAGIFRSLVPADLGGAEVHPAELRAAIEAIASADGSAGWIAAIGATAGLAAAYLPGDAARELFATPETIAAGVFAPLGRLTHDEPADGDLELSGSWPLGSGVAYADVVGLGCIDAERGPLYALVRRDEVEVVDTWDSLGLRATASHDVAAAVIPVPAEHVVDLLGGRPVADGPLYEFPLFGLLAICVSAVCTGIARGALADVIAAGDRKPAGSMRGLAERGTTQERVAASAAALRAAKSGVEAAIDRAWALVTSGQPLGVQERAGLRLASTHAAKTALDTVDAAHRLGGSRAIYRGSTLERRLRDVHTAAQHMVVAPGTLELAGRVLLGLEADTTRL